MKTSHLLWVILLAVLMAASAGCVYPSSPYPEAPAEMALILDKISANMGTEADKIAESLTTSSQVLSQQILWSDEFDQTLKRLYAKIPYALSTRYINYSDGRSAGYPTGASPDFAYVNYADTKTEGKAFSTFKTPLRGNILVAGVPVYAQNGEICGGLYCLIEVTAIPDIACSMVPESKGYYLTIGSASSGKLLYHPYDERIGTAAPYTVPDIAKTEGAYSFTDASGVLTTAVYRRSVFSNETMIVSLNLRGAGAQYAVFEMPENASRQDMASYVGEIRAAQGNTDRGKLAEYINDLQKEGSRYPLFFMKTDGRSLASTNPEYANRDLCGNVDAYAVPVQQLNTVTALRGGGYSLSYMMLSPDTALFEAVPVLNYVQMVDTGSYLLSYIPLSDTPEAVDISKKYDVEKASVDSLLYAMKYGEQALFEAVTAKTMPYPEGVECIILAYDGVLLADSLNPELSGTDGNSLIDGFNNSFGRNVVSMAESGNCNMYYCYPNPSEMGKITIYLCSLEILSGTGIVCTMMPISEVVVP